MRHRPKADTKGPAVRYAPFLAGVNVLCGVIAVAQSVVVARWLGAPGLAVIGVLVAINLSFVNLLDTRLADVATKLYYAPDTDDVQRPELYRQSVIQLCLLGNASLGLVVSGLGALVGASIAGLFLDQSIEWRWVALQAGATGTAFLTSTILFLHRLTGRFFELGITRLATQGTSTLIIVGALSLNANLGSYFFATATAALTILATSSAISCHAWKRSEGLNLLGRGVGTAGPDYLAEARTLVAGTVFGYTKLLHRAGDVLLVGLVSSDAQTGLYRLARTLTDGLYMLYDAFNQVYFPTFMRLYSSREFEMYRSLARRFAVGAAVTSLAALLGATLVLPAVVDPLLGHEFHRLPAAASVLVIPTFFVAGLHLWLWPIFLQTGLLPRLTALSGVGALVQSSLVLGIGATVGGSAVLGAVAYCFYYFITYPLALVMVRQRALLSEPTLATQAP